MGQTHFQDPATTTMEGLFKFNIHLLFLIISIVLFVAWLLIVILLNFKETKGNSFEKFNHSSPLEIVWTTIPAIILLSLAYPSFSLLYSLDEVSTPELALKISGHQWYWGYEVSDFNYCSKNLNLKYNCYMLSDEYLEKKNKAFFRGLETNKRVCLPTNTHLRLLVTAVDVLHSWTIPSFGVKIDACPGRLNQVNLFLKRFGMFFGQCSEICGVNHGFMPIATIVVPSHQFYFLIRQNYL